MDKLKMQSMDKVQGNVEKIRALFPNAVTEVLRDGKVELAVDFDVLKQELADTLIDERELRYQFTWPDKQKSVLLANTPVNKTLRPCKEESVDFDNTQNLYIEGDNLEVLKLLQETYLGKVKMIYIDPPYNTGNDFVYNDDFAIDSQKYMENSGQYDEKGNRLVKNLDSNGRFHTDWLNMIYPRLKVAKDLLSDDGVIFISIDDNEVENLRKICDEVFGSQNFIGLFTIMSNPRGSQNSKYISSVHEYIMMYCKNESCLEIRGIEKDNDSLSEFKEFDENGRKYRLLGLRKRGGAWRKEDRPNMYYPIYVNPQNGHCSLDCDSSYTVEVIPKRPTGELSRWTWGKDKFIAESEILIGKRVNRSGESESWDVFRKDYIDSDDGVEKTTKIKTMWVEKEINYQNAKNEIKALFGNSEIFDYPKPTYIVSQLARMLYTEEDDIILDFFSGSATTAHAVMQLNAEDGGNRKFIMVQLPEPCDEKSEAYKAGYKNICEIGKERIRRAGAKIKKEIEELNSKPIYITKNESGQVTTLFDTANGIQVQGKDLTDLIREEKILPDIGFRVLKLDSSNMQDVYYNPSAMTQSLLDATIDNVKPDRTPMDLLFQVMLELGVELSAKIEEKQVNGKKYYIVNDNDIIACFDDELNNEVITEIAKLQPLYAVFKDKSFATDSVGINNEQIFKTYSPITKVKVI